MSENDPSQKKKNQETQNTEEGTGVKGGGGQEWTQQGGPESGSEDGTDSSAEDQD